jgi:hypothetical protein
VTDPMQGRPGPAEPGASVPATLHDEHALLIREVTSRALAVLSEADEGRWPQQQLQELLNYLRLEVLQQIVDEEWLLFRAAHHAPLELARLRRDHLELRLAIDVLAQAAAAGESAERLSPRQLSVTTCDLLAQLEQHLVAEEELTSMGAGAPATASLGAQPHEWYSLIEGPVVDVDQLPGEQGVDAVRGGCCDSPGPSEWRFAPAAIQARCGSAWSQPTPAGTAWNTSSAAPAAGVFRSPAARSTGRLTRSREVDSLRPSKHRV